MKKTMTFLAVVALLVSMMAMFAQAEEPGVGETFFPDGKISTPGAPYVVYEDRYDDGEPKIASTQLFFDVPEDLLSLNAEYALLGEEAFCEKYHTALRGGYREALRSCIQIDTRFDDGPWLSESGNWDAFDYGENMECANLNYRLEIGRYMDETSKLFHFEQSWLVYNEVENENNAFLQPYLRSFQNGDDIGYQLDTENHTFSYRIRFIVYTNNGDDLDEGQEPFRCASDWSPAASIGREGTQETLVKPTKVEAPVLSDFKLIKNEDNGVEARYYVEFTKGTYDSIKYFSAVEDYFEPFYIESQIRVNNGEWVDTYTANAADLCGGYRSTDSNEVEITMDSVVEIRVRIVCSAMDGAVSEWSNIVGNKPEAEITPAAPTEEKPEEPTPTPTEAPTVKPEPEKDKCKVCGICPVQPLGICLFIWIAIIIVLIVVVLIVVKSRKDKDEKGEKK